MGTARDFGSGPFSFFWPIFVPDLSAMKKVLWMLFGFFAVAIGLYPGLYFIIDRRFGLLSTKSGELLADAAWNTGFYLHIIFGGLALLTGWTQFSARLRRTRPGLHRKLGKIYVISALVGGTAGIGIGTQATGGTVAALGFIILGIIWVYTTLTAYGHIRARRIAAHEIWMTYSFAACFAAVTLRLWMPLLILLTGDFFAAYRVVAWLCWAPNLLAAWWMNNRSVKNPHA